jgi:HEAT repeat protein
LNRFTGWKFRAFILLGFVVITGSCAKIETLEKQNRETFTKIIQQYQSPDWEVRRTAINELSSYSYPLNDPYFPVLEKTLVSALDDSHPMVRIEAFKSLQKLPDIRVRSRIAEIAINDPSPNIRWSAIRTLAIYKDPAFVNAFIIGLGSDDWLIREESIRGLLLIDDNSIKLFHINSILAALEDRELSVRLATLENLSLKDPRLYNSIARMLNSDMGDRNTQLKGLLHAIQGYELDPETKRRVTDLLLHPNTDIRVLALRVMKSSEDAASKQKRG